MKKLFILIAAICLVFSACKNKGGATQDEPQAAQQEQAAAPECQLTDEQKAIVQDWKNWDNLDETRKTEILDKCKGYYDRNEMKKIECERKNARFDTLMSNWDNMTLDEKKAAFEFATAICEHHGDNHGEHHAGEADSAHCQQYNELNNR